MKTLIYVIMEEIEDWNYDGDSSYSVMVSTPVGYFHSIHEAVEYCASSNTLTYTEVGELP